MKNVNKHGDDARWLKDNLDDLLADSDASDAKKERKRLEEMLGRFNNLIPALEKTSDKSAVFSKAYDFRDGMNKRQSWLDDAQKQVMDQPFIDGLEDARTYLHEHEVRKNHMILSKLMSLLNDCFVCLIKKETIYV